MSSIVPENRGAGGTVTDPMVGDAPSDPATGGSTNAEAGAAGELPDAGETDPAPEFNCTGSVHPICLDFESGALDPSWEVLGNDVNVETGNAVSGEHSLHITNPKYRTRQIISTTEVTSLRNVLWGRFYLQISPGAPDGHGALLYAYDQDKNRYEVGYENNAFMANWQGNPEKYMRTHVKIPDEWVCVEFLFDGATPKDAVIWVDEVLAPFYIVADRPGPTKVSQWTRMEVGFRSWHGTSLNEYKGVTPPATTDIWIDDIAFGNERIGCK